MNQPDCTLLDDYLASELDAEERGEFEQHLGVCRTCQAAIELQRSIDRSLLAGAALEIVPPPVTQRIGEHIGTARRRQRLAFAMSSAATLVLVACASWSLYRHWLGDGALRPTVVHDKDHVAAVASQTAPRDEDVPGHEPVKPVRVGFPDSNSHIAAEVKSDDPTVSIFMIYPVFTTGSHEIH